MNNFKLLKNEINTIYKSKIILVMMFLNILSMILGMDSIKNSNDFHLYNLKRTSMTTVIGSAKYGAAAGVLIFSIITIFLLSKDKRKRSNLIIDSYIDYSKLMIIRILSIIFYAVVTTFLGIETVMLVQKLRFNIPFDGNVYLYCFCVILLPALIFSILISSGLYMFTDSIDISILIVIVLFFMSMFSQNYLLAWVNSKVDIFSDFAGVRPFSKLATYNRFLWIFASIGIFILGFLCKRLHQQDIFKSLSLNIKNNKIVSIVFVFVFCMSLGIWFKEPYLNSTSFFLDEEINKDLKLTKLNPEVILNTERESMSAKIEYEFENNNSDNIKFAVNDGLRISKILVNNKETNYKKIDNSSLIEIDIPKEKNISLLICYEGKIKYDKSGAVAGYICKNSVYILENSNWIFKPLTSKSDLVDIYGWIKAPENLTVVTPGKLLRCEKENEQIKWSYGLKTFETDIGVFAGEYKKCNLKAGGADIEFYYSPRHEEYIEYAGIKEQIKNIMNYYGDNFGKYFTREYPLKIVEAALYKSGGHSSANVITFAEYTLNRDIARCEEDENKHTFTELSYWSDIKLIAHELSHQWWGSAVNAEGEEPWSNEGFAEYSAYKYIDKEFKEMASSYFLYMWKDGVESTNNSFYLMNEERLNKLNKNLKERIQNQKRFCGLYKKMPLKLIKGEEALGEEKFLSNLSKVYEKHFLKNLTFDDFLNEMGLTREVLSLE